MCLSNHLLCCSARLHSICQVELQDQQIKQQQTQIKKLYQRSHIIVDQSGKGSFATITEAVAAAEDGDRIIINQGVHGPCILLCIPWVCFNHMTTKTRQIDINSYASISASVSQNAVTGGPRRFLECLQCFGPWLGSAPPATKSTKPSNTTSRESLHHPRRVPTPTNGSCPIVRFNPIMCPLS